MESSTQTMTIDLQVSDMAENLIGSEIIKLAGEVNEKIKAGAKIHNFTIGDFNPEIFPIPEELKQNIISAYQNNITNYPAANGMTELRTAVSNYLSREAKLDYSPEDILIAGGARPLIYAVYRALVNPNEKVLFPVPSWNNNHYSHLSGAQLIEVETLPEDNFMPSAEILAPHIQESALVALCSPLNPTGTIFSKEKLEDICNMILAENKRRGPNVKPLYLLYDQIYWQLTYGDNKHFDPVSLNPDMRPYTIYIDGISKVFAATGVRVGWAFGPTKIINKMKSILGHVGAWAPKAEQVATADFLNNTQACESYLTDLRTKLNQRLQGFYEGFQALKASGFSVDAVTPQAALYLTVKIDLKGMYTQEGTLLSSTEDVTRYILNEAHTALVPFYAFGTSKESPWYRLSVGTSKLEDIAATIEGLRNALQKLTPAKA